MRKTSAHFARWLAGVFLVSSSVFACDGLLPTCPATSENSKKYNWDSDGFTGPDKRLFIFSSPSEATQSACNGAKLSERVSSGNGITCTISVACPHTFNVLTDSETNYSAEGTARIRTYCTNADGVVQDNSGYPRFYIIGMVTTNYECRNSLYPVGPDINRQCHKTNCTSGKRYNSFSDNGVSYSHEGPHTSSYCQSFEEDGVTQKCLVLTSQGGICGKSTCLYDYVTQTGQTCPPETPEGSGSDGEPCVTYPDGHRACDSDATPEQEDSTPGENGTGSRCITHDGKQYCIDVTPPNDNCAQTPTIPECMAPQEQNCAFVGGQYHCSDASDNCGTFNGVNVCLCPDGSVQEPGGPCSVVPGGSGAGGLGQGGTGSSGSAQDVVDGLTEDTPGTGEYKLNGGFDNSDVDGFISGISREYDHGIQANGAQLIQLPATTECRPYSFSLPYAGEISINVPCVFLGWVRSILEWLLNVAMIFITWKRFREAI